jgi:hypothetical protein
MAGYNNWFDIKIDHNPTDIKQSKFDVIFNHTKPTKSMSFQDSADYTAKTIADDYDNLYLSMSGGLDSEFIAEVFFRNNIPFTPIIAATDTSVDYHYALYWCKIRNIKPVIVNLSEEEAKYFNFVANILKTKQFGPREAYIPTYLSTLISTQNGHLVTGEATLNFKTKSFDSCIGEVFKSDYHQFMVELIYPGQHPGGFLFYTPEIVLSTAINIDTTLNDAYARTKLYDIVPFRPKQKPNRVFSDRTYSLLKFNVQDIGRKTWSKSELVNLLLHGSDI